MKYDIFISYRREGGDTLAQLIYDRLTHRGYNVFLDIESLNNGKFNEKLLAVIEECKDLVVILPSNALDRCHNEGDWLLLELQHAIKHKKNIIPVMMKGFYFPDNMPESIAELQYFNGIQDNKDYFDAVIDKIATLLTSKPSFGGKFFQKKLEKKVSFAQQMKKRKRFFVLLLLLILLAIGGFFFLRYQQKLQKEHDLSYVNLRITAPEEMTASEYYSALEILEDRFEILADGADFSFETEADQIQVSIPMDAFHGLEIESILQCYVTRPTKLYIADAEQSFAVDRAKIKSVTMEQGPLDSIDLTNYAIQGIEDTENYQYISLEFTDDVSQEFKDFMENAKAPLQLRQDTETNSSWYYYVIADDFTSSEIHILDNYQYENIQNLIEYNFTHDTFSQPFYFYIEKPVDWEDIKNTEQMIGNNQCNIDQLSGPLIRLVFSTYTEPDEISDGEYRDTIAIMKERLDALATPYAFGYHAQNNYEFVVKIDCSLMNDQIINLVCTSYAGVSIRSDFYDLLSSSSIETMEVIQNEDGNYSLVITPDPDSYSVETLQKNLAELTAVEENPAVYLCNSSSIPFDESTLSECFDGEKFTFDSLTSFGLETITEEYRPVLDLLKVCTTGFNYPISYSLEGWGRENVDPNATIDEILKIQEILTEPVTEFFEGKLSEILGETDHSVKLQSMGQSVSIHILLEQDMLLPSEVNHLLQSIYEECDLDSGKTNSISIYFKDIDENIYISCNFNRSSYGHKMSISGYYYTNTPESFTSEFEEILYTDPFYEQFYVGDYDLNENGKLTFIN